MMIMKNISFFFILNNKKMVVTFYTHTDPKVTAKFLDNRRLAKQRVEAKQIIDVLEKGSGGWSNHPATKMWQGYVNALKDYFNIMCLEFISRGGDQGMPLYELSEPPEYPPWCYCERLQYSHQARLMQKEPTHYCDLFSPPKEYLQYGYIWPSKHSLENLYYAPLEKIAEPFKEDKMCIAIKKNGLKCVSKASYGDHCGVHKPKDFTHQICMGVKKSGERCAFRAKEGNYCNTHKNQSGSASHGAAAAYSTAIPDFDLDTPEEIKQPVVTAAGNCNAILKSGEPCKYKAKYNGYCGRHKQ